MPRTCSIARSLEVVGERWALLVVREVALGTRRFSDIRQATGAPPAVLTARLHALVDAGVLTTRPYREPGRRSRTEYVLTDAGRDLQPVLTALMDWGDRHLAGPDGPPVATLHDGCGAPVHARLVCDEGHALDGRAVRVRPAPGRDSAEDPGRDTARAPARGAPGPTAADRSPAHGGPGAPGRIGA